MRVKMGFSHSTPMCSLCNSHLETLPHIFLKCSHTLNFRSVLQDFICTKIDANYCDLKSVHFIISNHNNKVINYVNIAAKWYISKQFQSCQPLLWVGFKKSLRLALNGEKLSLRDILLQVLWYLDFWADKYLKITNWVRHKVWFTLLVIRENLNSTCLMI